MEDLIRLAESPKQPWDAKSTPIRCACQGGTAISCIVLPWQQESHLVGAVLALSWAGRKPQILAGFWAVRRCPLPDFRGLQFRHDCGATRSGRLGKNAKARVEAVKRIFNYTFLVQVWKSGNRSPFSVLRSPFSVLRERRG